MHAVVPGGSHPTKTHNALIGFTDGSYLEPLAFYEPNPQSRWRPKLAQGGGLIARAKAYEPARSDNAKVCLLAAATDRGYDRFSELTVVTLLDMSYRPALYRLMNAPAGHGTRSE